MNLTRIYDAVLTLAYPQVCVICGRSVEQRRFGVACETCWSETRIFTDEERICLKCGAPDQERCGRCEELAFTAARAAGIYESALRESVLLLKRQPYVPRHVESLLTEVVRREPLSRSTRVIPAPLHPKRLKTRGFNQASVIGQTVSKVLKLPLDEVSLVRVSITEKYRAGMDTKGRRDTVAGAFRVAHPRLVAGENILLVDDVFTTGATISACAEALIAARAEAVFVLTIGRALR
ncbi:MAG TPA: double zinc ribbon domain-containing protein [Pyrinomonadaceae bacterium]|nr:double zinc ribbon domain-containing protein [Pyrinomonadaceae bacterium]